MCDNIFKKLYILYQLGLISYNDDVSHGDALMWLDNYKSQKGV